MELLYLFCSLCRCVKMNSCYSFFSCIHSSEKSQLRWAGRRLETDVCVAGHQAPDPEVIQNYVKRVSGIKQMWILWRIVSFLNNL